jgi:WD40-like Beta Propeller Repeat
MDSRLPIVIVLAGALGCGAAGSSPHDGAASPDAVASSPDVTDTTSPPSDVAPMGMGTPFGANIGPVTTCDTSKPFGPAAMVEGSIMDDDSFTFSRDFLTIYLASARGTGADSFDIWVATRPSLTARFGQLYYVPGSSGGADRYPVLSHDGLRLYHTWEEHEVRIAARSSVTAEFDTFGVLEGLFEFGAGRIWLSADEKLVYFDTGNTTPGNGADLFVADFAKDAATNMRMLAAVNSTSDETGPVLTGDDLTLYFSSNRPAATGADGSFRMYVARRAKISDPFGAPKLLDEFVPAIHDNVFSVSPEGCTIYFRRLAEHADHYPMVATRGM